MRSALDFGQLPKATGATLRASVTFASDLAAVGGGATLSGNATVSGSTGLTATHVSTTGPGVVTFTVAGGTDDVVGVVTFTATYSNGEIQQGFLEITPG